MPGVVNPLDQTAALGDWALGRGADLRARLAFLGDLVLALGRLVRSRSRRAEAEISASLDRIGVGSLPIVAVFAVSTGVALSLLATQQLDRVGLPGLAPRLVGIVILRELAALMTGLALAGPVGARLALEIAQVMGDVDDSERHAAGHSVLDRLVAPRILALTLAGPLLVAYADAFALLAAAITGIVVTDITWLSKITVQAHLETTTSTLAIDHAVAGFIKGALFGFVVGVASSWHALGNRPGSRGLGDAVRRAVVASAASVAVADLALTFMFKWVRL
ncbi:MAG: ABC transporter permease [Vicinamibacteria bacterium]|nr:ABC transporter permease [Vicinamibacteria bacterium]